MFNSIELPQKLYRLLENSFWDEDEANGCRTLIYDRYPNQLIQIWPTNNQYNENKIDIEFQILNDIGSCYIQINFNNII